MRNLILPLLLFLGCQPPSLPVCNHVHVEGVRVEVVAADVRVLDASFTVEGEAVEWWDECGANLELEGSANGHPVQVTVQFPKCED